jgi:AcrR family transcriptional regulator
MRTDAISSVTRILDAARSVFATGDGTGTLNKIAQEAGVGIATLYRHFPNRQTLARAVYERLFTSEIEPLLTQLESGDAPREELLEVAERIADVARRERGLVASLGGLGAATADLLAPHAEAFDALVARGQAAGNLRTGLAGADVPHLLAMFASAAAALEVDADARRRYLDLFLDALRPPTTRP